MTETPMQSDHGRTVTVLVGAGGSGTAFAIVSRLRSSFGSGLRIVTMDVNEAHLVTASLLADGFCQAPYAHEETFSGFVADVLLRESVDVYIPILNEEIRLAARLAEDPRFSQVDFWSSALHAACTDKGFAADWLSGLGVDTPERYSPARAYADSSRWFAKPLDGYGSHDARQVTMQELQKMTAAERDQLMVQALCDGPEVTVDSFWDANANLGYAYCRERLEVKAGVCTRARVFSDPALSGIAAVIGRSLGQRGTICFQVMKTGGRWAVTDLNPRSGAGTALTCAAGFDVLSAAFACRQGADYSRYVRPLAEGEEFHVTRQYAEFVMRHSR
ncbi:MAG: ATP-grasp domain-containing protein [Proteobacteria bacterium]|nr:ATP-grasp domain-containing protein [Pseudomonadota bacterium]